MSPCLKNAASFADAAAARAVVEEAKDAAADLQQPGADDLFSTWNASPQRQLQANDEEMSTLRRRALELEGRLQGLEGQMEEASSAQGSSSGEHKFKVMSLLLGGADAHHLQVFSLRVAASAPRDVWFDVRAHEPTKSARRG